MLVLTRKPQEQIRVGEDVVITILRIKGQSVRIGIEAPPTVSLLRAELSPHQSTSEPQRLPTASRKQRPATPVRKMHPHRETLRPPGTITDPFAARPNRLAASSASAESAPGLLQRNTSGFGVETGLRPLTPPVTGTR